MKRCPECRRDYYDDTLLYCLDDGARLVDGPARSDEAVTAIVPDLTSEPETRIFEPQASSPATKGSRRTVIIGLTVMVVIGIVGYLYYGRSSTGQIRSIAVMPIENKSGDPEFEYLSDGLTDSIIGSLAQIPDLNVKARSSVIRYKGSDATAKDIGTELGVDAILNGRIVRRGPELNLHLELVDARTENSLWTQIYNQVISNLAVLQNGVARDVAEKLKLTLSGADKTRLERTYTQNAEANRLYLLGRYHWNKRTKNDLLKAIDLFQQALALDPNYPLPYAGLADVHHNLPGYDRTISSRESDLMARENALKALSLDETLAEAHVSLGVILQTRDYDFAGAEREFKRAIELDPTNAQAYTSYSVLLSGFGRHEEAVANIRRALELEPASLPMNRAYGLLLMFARRYDESEAQLKKTIDLDPNFVLAHYSIAGLYTLMGRHAEAAEAYARSREVAGDHDNARSIRASFASGGSEGFMRDLTNNKWPTSSSTTPEYILATNLAAIGEKDRALAALEKAHEDRNGFMIWINVDPRFDSVREDPRFQQLVRQVGLPLQTGL